MKKKKGKTANTGGGVKKDNEEQSRRFIETAKELKADKSETLFREALDHVKTKTNSDN